MYNHAYDDTVESDEEPGQEQNYITDYPYSNRIVNEEEAMNGGNLDINIDNGYDLSPLPDEEIQGSSQHGR